MQIIARAPNLVCWLVNVRVVIGNRAGPMLRPVTWKPLWPLHISASPALDTNRLKQPLVAIGPITCALHSTVTYMTGMRHDICVLLGVCACALDQYQALLIILSIRKRGGKKRMFDAAKSSSQVTAAEGTHSGHTSV